MNKDLLEKYRDINVNHDNWYECVYSVFGERLRDEVGVEVEQIYFSGFWSQGDGACFEGCVADWRAFLNSLGYTNEVLINFARHYWTFKVKHYGHYAHENCTQFDSDIPSPDDTDEDSYLRAFGPYYEDDLRAKAWLAVLKTFEFAASEAEFIDKFKDHMRELYKRLQAEYDDLTSDEAVWEAIVANELDTTKEEI